jgi:hypothetical protein
MVLKLERISLWEGALSTIGQGLRENDSNLPKGTVPRSQNGTRADLSKWTDFAHTYASIVLDVLAGAWENRKEMEKG